MEDTEEGLKITIITSVSGFLAGLWSLLVMKRIVRDTPEDLTIIVEQIKTDMKNNVLFKTKFKKIIDAFWLRRISLKQFPTANANISTIISGY